MHTHVHTCICVGQHTYVCWRDVSPPASVVFETLCVSKEGGNTVKREGTQWISPRDWFRFQGGKPLLLPHGLFLESFQKSFLKSARVSLKVWLQPAQNGSQHIHLESDGMGISCQQKMVMEEAEGETEQVLTVDVTHTAQNNRMHV